MIVTCSNCDTSFQLDDARVPAQGIRVRCSRCKEAFFLQNPSASNDEAVDAVASAAAQSGGSVAPNATQDLPPDGKPKGDEDEHDWEFNVDPNGAGESEDTGGDDFGEADLEAASALALDGESEPMSDVAAAPTVEDDAEEESAFGSVDDFSSLMEEDDLEAGGLDPEIGESIAEDRPATGSAPTNLADAGQYAAAGRSSEDLGEPENWDFFGDGGDEAGGAPSPGGPGPGVLGRLELAPRGAVGPAASGIGALAEAWGADEEDDYEAEAAPPGLVARGIEWAGQVAGWVATIVLIGVGLTSGFWATAESLVGTAESLEVGPLQAENVRGEWVETARGDMLLAVVGELHSRDPRPVVAAGIVEVTLLDHAGRPLEVDAQPAGVPVSEVSLREAEPDALRLAQDRAAWSLADGTIERGRGTPFQAIFRDVPGEAAHVALRVTRSNRPSPEAGLGAGPNAAVDPLLGSATVETPTEGAEVGASSPAADPGAAQGTSPEPSATPSPTPSPTPAAPALPSELTWGE